MAGESVISSGALPPAEFTPTTIARRSVSIFSRRGTETPISRVVHVQGFSQSVPSMSAAQQPPAAPKPPSKKAWKLGNAHGHGATILRAVPKMNKTDLDKQSSTRSPTSYEIETAANEEILQSAFGDASNYPLHQAHMTPTSQISPFPDTFPALVLPQAVSFPPNEKPIAVLRKPLGRAARKQSKEPLTEKSEQIGVWKDGQVIWDQMYSPTSSSAPSSGRSSIESRSNSTASVTSRGSIPQAKSPRPKIQVIIPENTYRTFAPLVNVPLLSVPRIPGNIDQRPKTAPEKQSTGSRELPPLQTATVLPTIQTFAPTPQRRRSSPEQALPSLIGELEVARKSHKFRPSMASSVSSSLTDDGDNFKDDASNYSARSSRTSVDSLCLDEYPEIKPLELQRSGSVAFSIISPAKAGVFDESRMNSVRTVRSNRPGRDEYTNEPFTPISNGMLPSTRPMDAAQAALRLTQWLESRAKKPEIPRKSSTRARVAALRAESLRRTKTPTLSEAEAELQAQLTAITERFTWDQDCPEEPAASNDAPPIPARKSRVRWQPAELALAEQLSKGREIAPEHLLHVPSSPTLKRRGLETVQRLPSVDRRAIEAKLKHMADMKERIEQTVSPQAAEMVILSIFENLGCVKDLLAASSVNKGFYRVYKRNQLYLLKTVLLADSPAAWEFMETCIPCEDVDPESAAPKPEWTAGAYLESYKRNKAVIREMKILFLQRCRSILRVDIVRSLESEDKAIAKRADDALWRIWTFCKIFGSGKGREDDIIGQMDWLHGGVLAHQNSCTSTISTTDSFYMSNVLLSAGEHFAKGNKGGLAAEQLYDMTELWTCLGVFVQGLEGRTDQARSYGVYETTDVRGGDVDGEEAMLEEWVYYLFTLGLGTVLAMASTSSDPNPTPFALAKDNGWMAWSPPVEGGSRSTFLKEAVARVYEEKIASSFNSPAAASSKDENREQQRQRGQSFAAELRQRRMSGDSPVITQAMERPMSGYTVISELDSERPSPASVSSGGAYGLSPSGVSAVRSTGSVRSATSRRTGAHLAVVSPMETINESRHSAIEEQFQELERMSSGPDPENSADRAIKMITEMGFSREDAGMALRVTDMGDGLRVDRAIEWLLRR